MRAHPRWLLAAGVLLCVGCAGPAAKSPRPELSDAGRAFYVRRSLEDARAFQQQGRLEAAERALRRGLAVSPEDPRLHETLAGVLEELDLAAAAEEHQRRADALDPPPPLPPDAPLGVRARGVVVALIAPDPAETAPGRQPADWPEGPEAATLERRLRVRLPEATVLHAAPETVEEARRALGSHAPRAAVSLRVERSYCGATLKDGPFAMAWLRVATGRSPAEVVRDVQLGPHPESDRRRKCERAALSRALELALALPAVDAALRAPRSPETGWSNAEVRDLFPDLSKRVRQSLDEARNLLAAGDVMAASDAVGRAARIDPEDPDVRAYRHEIESTLSLARELRPKPVRPSPALLLDPRLTAAQTEALEERLDEERRRRDELLAALAVLDEDERAPDEKTLGALRGVRPTDGGAFGPRTARERAGSEVEARAAYAPDGEILAVYYFRVGSGVPVVREEDTRGDGRSDRWIGYVDGIRRDLWEDTSGDGRPDVHLAFSEGTLDLERIELDTDHDGSPDQVFRYEGARLVAEAKDSDGDGVLDRFDTFDEQGRVAIRREDLDGDGRIDIRSDYEKGRLVRRELSRPDLVPVPDVAGGPVTPP